MNFEQAFDLLIAHEGGFSNNPADGGGATMYGVTEQVARQNGYTGAMKDLTLDFAKVLYRKLYWDAIRLEDMPEDVRFTVFDAAVNSGTGRAVKWLQQSVGVVGDGVIGDVTLRAVRQAIPSITAARISGIRLLFMTNQPNWGTFGKGWSIRVAKNLMGA